MDYGYGQVDRERGVHGHSKDRVSKGERENERRREGQERRRRRAGLGEGPVDLGQPGPGHEWFCSVQLIVGPALCHAQDGWRLIITVVCGDSGPRSLNLDVMHR
jgi:hypothetical protein